MHPKNSNQRAIHLSYKKDMEKEGKRVYYTCCIVEHLMKHLTLFSQKYWSLAEGFDILPTSRKMGDNTHVEVLQAGDLVRPCDNKN